MPRFLSSGAKSNGDGSSIFSATHTCYLGNCAHRDGKDAGFTITSYSTKSVSDAMKTRDEAAKEHRMQVHKLSD